MAAQIGSYRACLDDRKFLLIISEKLAGPDRVAVAREAFAAVGQPQPDDGTVICLCGLAVTITNPLILPGPPSSGQDGGGTALTAALHAAYPVLLRAVGLLAGAMLAPGSA